MQAADIVLHPDAGPSPDQRTYGDASELDLFARAPLAASPDLVAYDGRDNGAAPSATAPGGDQTVFPDLAVSASAGYGPTLGLGLAVDAAASSSTAHGVSLALVLEPSAAASAPTAYGPTLSLSLAPDVAASSATANAIGLGTALLVDAAASSPAGYAVALGVGLEPDAASSTATAYGVTVAAVPVPSPTPIPVVVQSSGGGGGGGVGAGWGGMASLDYARSSTGRKASEAAALLSAMREAAQAMHVKIGRDALLGHWQAIRDGAKPAPRIRMGRGGRMSARRARGDTMAHVQQPSAFERVMSQPAPTSTLRGFGYLGALPAATPSGVDNACVTPSTKTAGAVMRGESGAPIAFALATLGRAALIAPGLYLAGVRGPLLVKASLGAAGAISLYILLYLRATGCGR